LNPEKGKRMKEETPVSASPQQPGSGAPVFKRRLARSMAFALLALAILPIFLMGGVGYLRTRYILQEQISTTLQDAAKLHADQISQALNTRKIRIDRIVRREDFRTAANALFDYPVGSTQAARYRVKVEEAFNEVNAPSGQPLFNQFVIADKNGLIYAASLPSWIGASIKNFQTLRTYANEPFAIGVYDAAPISTGQFSIWTVSPFKNDEGGVDGYLIGTTRADESQELLGELKRVHPAANAFYVTQNGDFIGISKVTYILDYFLPTESQQEKIGNFIETVISENETAKWKNTEYINDEGKKVLAEILWIPSMRTAVVIEIPEEVIFAQLDSLAPFTIFLTLLTLAAMGFLVWVGTVRVVRPILELSQKTRRFAEGDWSVRAEVSRDDEIGLLSYSFNKMAEELSQIYQSLETQIEERTRQIRTAAEVAQDVVSAGDLEDLLHKTVSLIVERFEEYYHAGIFLLDGSGKVAILKAAYGPAAEEMLKREHRLTVGSSSIIGWVTAHNQPRVASDVTDDPVHFKNELLPDTRAEAGIPITAGNLVLGALDVQSTQPNTFDEETIITLQTLANQIAVAIQNLMLAESTQVNLGEIEQIHRASRQIAQAENEKEILDSTEHVLQNAPFVSGIFTIQGDEVEIFSILDPDTPDILTETGKLRGVSAESLANALASGLVIVDVKEKTTLPNALMNLAREKRCQRVAFLPVTSKEKLYAVIMLGARQGQMLNVSIVQPYIGMIEIITATLEKLDALASTERRLIELEAISSVSQAVLTTTDLPSLYRILHEHIRRILGDIVFAIALYDAKANTIQLPYIYEDGEYSSVDPYPLGEGLTSIVIQTREPLLLHTSREIKALGGKQTGQSTAKSWLGTPLLIGGEPIGVLILQNSREENYFNEDDLRFASALANQISGALHNTRLLEDSRQRAAELMTTAEIARDISGFLHLDELLQKAVNLIRDRLSFYHAAIFLIDPSGEYAVIREATGEAGAQMKRSGHKLGVGSKSTVGYVAGSGTPLVINDTTKDATHYANPLLPHTRAEAAIPLKVGERILGVIDVQSTKPYAFTQETLQMLQILADQVAIGIVTTELFAESQEHLSQHRLLHHITTSAASGTTLEEALDSAVRGLQVTLGGDRVSILMPDREKKTLKIYASIGYSEESIRDMSIPIGSGITGWSAAHQRILRVDDVTKDPRYIQISANTRSELAIPLVFRNELLGVLNVESEQAAAYDAHDEEMLGTLAGSLAAIIANARLVEQIRRQAERERMLYEITSKIRRSGDIHNILKITANELGKAVGARRTQIKLTLQEASSEPEREENR